MSGTIIHSINYIVSTPDICGGKPHVDGTRHTVEFLAKFQDGSRSVADLCARYDLTPAKIYAAWSYYEDHRDEIDQGAGEEDSGRLAPNKPRYCEG